MKPLATAYSQRLLRGQTPSYERLQARFAEAAKNNRMEEIINNVRHGHDAMVELLTEAMGHVQFHFVVCRVGQRHRHFPTAIPCFWR